MRAVAWLTVLAAFAALAATFARGRRGAPSPGTAEWPPFEPRLVTDTAPSAPGWIEPGADGAVPATHPIKVKVSSGIYHVPGGRFYDRTSADRLYPTTGAAEADGYRPSKS